LSTREEQTPLGAERSGLSGSEKLREQLSLLLRAGNFDPWHPYFSLVGGAAH